MCDISKGFTLCSCADKKALLKRKEKTWIWQLVRETREEDCQIIGEAIMPYYSAMDKELETIIEQELNSRNCFDFEFQPEQGEYLQLYNTDRPDKIFIFQFNGKRWEPYTPENFNEKLIIDIGVVKNKPCD